MVPHISIEIEEVEQDEKAGNKAGTGAEITDDDDDSQEVQEGDIFIPFTRSVELSRQYYKGSDPEWQEYINFSKDLDRQTQVCVHLQDVLVSKVSKQMGGAGNLLGNAVKSGKRWLEFTYPDGPPPTHSRDGLMIGNGRVVWGTEVVDDETHRRQMNLVWPKAAIDSMLFSGRIMLQLGYQSAMNLLGFNVDEKTTSAKDLKGIKQVVQMYKMRQEAAEHTDTDSTSSATPTAPQQADQTRPWPLSAFTKPDFSGAGQHDDIFRFARVVFSIGYHKSKISKKFNLPRGTFLVHGLVEIRGSRGRMLFDVQAAYDPREDRFVEIVADMKSYKQWAQRPRGGN